MESTIVFVLVAVVVLGALLAFFLRKEKTQPDVHTVDPEAEAEVRDSAAKPVSPADFTVLGDVRDDDEVSSFSTLPPARHEYRVKPSVSTVKTPRSSRRTATPVYDTTTPVVVGGYGLGYDSDLDGLPDSVDPVYDGGYERKAEPIDLNHFDQPISNAPVEPVVETPSYSTPAYEAPSYTAPTYEAPSSSSYSSSSDSSSSSSYDSGSSSSYDSGSSSSSDSSSSSY